MLADSVNADHFGDRLAAAVSSKNSAVCVGLDPRWPSLPESIRAGIDAADLERVAAATQCYCQEVIDAVVDSAAVIKPQSAFFEQLGPAGSQALYQVIQHARKRDLLVLLDAKRGDIGTTAEAYADAYLGVSSPWKADALTVNPYLGDDTLEPFTQTAMRRGAGLFVLVKTSNPGSGFLQDRRVEGQTIYQLMADTVQRLASETAGQTGWGSVGAVVGATYPEQLALLRQSMPNAWILIPGYGAQGGSADDVAVGFAKAASGKPALGAIVNSSRGIIFAYHQARYSHLGWQNAVAQAARDMAGELSSATA